MRSPSFMLTLIAELALTALVGRRYDITGCLIFYLLLIVLATSLKIARTKQTPAQIALTNGFFRGTIAAFLLSLLFLAGLFVMFYMINSR